MPKAFFQELSFLAESFAIVRNLDLLVISGGGQLLDSWGGPAAFPYTIFKWVLLARLARVKCYFLNLGAGPIDHPSSKWLIKSALFFADYISFRDGNSQAIVEKIGFKGESEVSVDCVYGLDLSEPDTTCSPAPEHPIVGLSPMAYCDPRLYWDQNQRVYSDYIHKFTEFGTWLISRQYRLKLFSTEISFDSHAMEELAIALKKVTDATGSRNIMLEPVDAFPGLLSAIRSSEYIVTCRYHGVVLAHLLNKPVLAISHHHKVATLMNDMGLSDYCVDIRTFDFGLLANTFIRMVENRDKIKTRMAERAARYRSGLSIQFDQLFPRIQETPLKGS
jgi:polysaccharide pyruvyl transferase WcaK-like protein